MSVTLAEKDVVNSGAAVAAVVPPPAVSSTLPKSGKLDPENPLRDELRSKSSTLAEKFGKIDEAVTAGRIEPLIDVLKDPRGLEPAIVANLARRLLSIKQNAALGTMLELAGSPAIEPAQREELKREVYLASLNGWLQPSVELKDYYSKILRSPDESDSNRRRALEIISSKAPERMADAFYWCLEHAPDILATASGVVKSLPESTDPRIQRLIAETIRRGGIDELSLQIRGVFDIACGDPNFLPKTIKSWRAAGIEADYCALLERSIKGKIDYPARYTGTSLTVILDARENDSTIAVDKNKPVVLFVMPKDGAKGALVGAAEAITELQKNARVIVIEASGEKDLIAQTQELKRREGRQFSALILNGHGDGANIALGTIDQLGLDPSKKDPTKTVDLTDESSLKAPEFSGCFLRRVNVLLISCYARRPPVGGNGQTVFSMFERVFPRGKIVGSDTSIEFKGLIFDRSGVPTGFRAR